MIEVICPHCKSNTKIITDEATYNLNRLKQSLYTCNCCSKTFLVFDDGEGIKVARISK